MAKVTRGDLKGIVKECLIEILAEGLLADGTTQMLEAPSKPKRKKPAPKKSRIPRVQHNQVIQEAVSELTDDPLMADIFSDTARGTLQEQMEAESGGMGAVPGDAASRQASASDPDDLFGEAAEKWAALAFAGPGPANKSPSSE
tara:strand:- start:40 stop:471 length:432 start_codon:yes stop_codon:yes gene_type:complete